MSKTPQEMKMFIFETSNRVFDMYRDDFVARIDSEGISGIRDELTYPEYVQARIEAFLGMTPDEIEDNGLFDDSADMLYGCMERAERYMYEHYFTEMQNMNDLWEDDKAAKPTRRAEEVLYECAELMQKKGAAYNGFPQAEYYPYGLRDIWYMCFTKVKRLESQIIRDGDKNFEGIEDSARDLINYASFLVEFAEGKMNGQEK